MAENSVDTPGSPFWWMKKLTDRQSKKLERLNALAAWMANNPPLPEGAAGWEAAYQAFYADTRTNVASLAVTSASNRLTPLGFRTGASNDDNGDVLAAEVWAANQMAVEVVDLIDWMLGLSESYTMVTPPPRGSKYPVITAEDPRQVITAHDPARRMIVRAGMKTLHDPDKNLDVCYIYLPSENGGQAEAYRATKPSHRGTSWGPNFRLSPKAWTWDDDLEPMGVSRVPITRFENRGGVAEYEPHLSVLRRINRITLQRMQIGEIQAFRQRAIEGLPDVYPDDYPVPELVGKKIDYEGIFTPGPGSLWKVPAGVKFWESQAIDLRPLLDEERMEYRNASALMGIPVSYFNPDDTNGSAEGASLQRESLLYRVEDRSTILDYGLANTMSLAFEAMGDRQRADVGQIETIWAPFERLSLTERFNAAVQGKAAGLANDTVRRYVLKMTPREMRQAELDDTKDMLLGVVPTSQQQALQIASTRTDRQPPQQRAIAAQPALPAPQPRGDQR